MEKLLVVCVGNICRSPVGERVLAAGIPNVTVSSAGIGALVGHGPEKTASDVAAARGVSLDGHVARQFTSRIGEDSDLILVMEPGHRRQIGRLTPHLLGRVMLFDHWGEAAGIPDPYRKSREYHENIFDLISSAADDWIGRLAVKGRK